MCNSICIWLIQIYYQDTDVFSKEMHFFKTLLSITFIQHIFAGIILIFFKRIKEFYSHAAFSIFFLHSKLDYSNSSMYWYSLKLSKKEMKLHQNVKRVSLNYYLLYFKMQLIRKISKLPRNSNWRKYIPKS